MSNKTSQNVGPSKIEAVSDNVDVKFKGRLLCVDGSTVPVVISVTCNT